jgi:hypothetical protein
MWLLSPDAGALAAGDGGGAHTAAAASFDAEQLWALSESLAAQIHSLLAGATALRVELLDAAATSKAREEAAAAAQSTVERAERAVRELEAALSRRTAAVASRECDVEAAEAALTAAKDAIAERERAAAAVLDREAYLQVRAL